MIHSFRVVPPSNDGEQGRNGPVAGTGGRRRWEMGAWLAACFARRTESGIASPESMWQQIQREQELVARGRPPFCVLLFEVGDPDLDPRPCRALIRVLRRRLRMADSVGWLTRGCAAVLLPATERDGALALAADMERLLAQEGTAIAWTLDSELFAGRVVPEGTRPSSEP